MNNDGTLSLSFRRRVEKAVELRAQELRDGTRKPVGPLRFGICAMMIGVSVGSF